MIFLLPRRRSVRVGAAAPFQQALYRALIFVSVVRLLSSSTRCTFSLFFIKPYVFPPFYTHTHTHTPIYRCQVLGGFRAVHHSTRLLHCGAWPRFLLFQSSPVHHGECSLLRDGNCKLLRRLRYFQCLGCARPRPKWKLRLIPPSTLRCGT